MWWMRVGLTLVGPRVRRFHALNPQRPILEKYERFRKLVKLDKRKRQLLVCVDLTLFTVDLGMRNRLSLMWVDSPMVRIW